MSGIVAGVEDHVRPRPLQLGDQRGQIGRGGRIALVQHDVHAGLLGAFLVALGDVDAIGAVLVDDGDAHVLRVLAELRLRIGGDHLGGRQPPLRAVRLRPEHVFQVTIAQHRRGDAGGDPHELLELLDARRGRHALGRGVEAQQHVHLFLLDQAGRFVDDNVGLALAVGVDRLDLVALDRRPSR